MRGMKTITSLFLLLFVVTVAAGKPANYVKRESQQDPGFFTLIVLPDTQGTLMSAQGDTEALAEYW